MLSNQELFDNAALGIKWQGYKPATDGNSCVVLDNEGRRCAIGHSCTDIVEGEGSTLQWSEYTKSYLGNALRIAHDTFLTSWGKDRWITEMARIAIAYKLDDSVLWFTEKE